ncbi:MAG: glycogen/starch synthase [Vallitaleaceae bacterium]|jgi:starch synthase|nr:glycogen/starch synthase [Vallitaleaceae bacterium]
MIKPLTVLFVSPEIIPFKATGGLADVAEALPHALNTASINTIRVMPKYKGIEDDFPIEKAFSFIVEAGRKANVAEVYKIDEDGLVTYFIGNKHYFERDNIYGYKDDDERFGFFCKATLEMLIFLDIKPDIIHLNDWQTALIGLFLKEEYAQLEFYEDIKVIFTIHNLQYQGVFPSESLHNLNLSTKYFNSEAIEYYGKICFMKAGIVYADLVTTVSKTYAKEIQTDRYGYGLDGLLRKNSYKIIGIVNGIYYDKYNPEIDKELVNNFDDTTFIEMRKANKLAMQKELGLTVDEKIPMLGVVTRLAEQKGIDLIIYAMQQLIRENVQFVILGSGEEEYEKKLLKLVSQHPDKVSVTIQFNMKLARQIYGTVDFFLMPSLFEPCGLSQLYSLRYGAVPVVRETGGLVDTIIDYTKDQKLGTGFSFTHFNGEEFIRAIQSGIEVYIDKTKWHTLIRRGMQSRFTWEKAAEEYIEEYNKVLKD